MMPLDKMRGGQLTIEGNFDIAQNANPTGWSSTTNIDMPLGISGDAVGKIQGGHSAKVMDDIEGEDGDISDYFLLSSKTYEDQHSFPFWVGANVSVSGTVAAGVAWDDGIAENCVITGINFEDGIASFQLDQSAATVTTVSGITDVTMELRDVGTPATDDPVFTIDSANLVLKKLASPPATQDTMTYTTWETEEFSTAGTTQLNQTFRLPASMPSFFALNQVEMVYPIIKK